ncbi:MAG: DUF2851 family protein [Bacteroidales bacterium]|nr:DUF2851 family protein [Bacteroidales bacterium]
MVKYQAVEEYPKQGTINKLPYGMHVNEKFLQYIWQYQLLDKKSLSTTNNKTFEVISPGTRNMHAGPDFFNAKIKIDNAIWAGNVEVHLYASDWQRHGHQYDEAYKNVILHVVLTNDKAIAFPDGQPVLCYEIKFGQHYLHNYHMLLENDEVPMCGHQLGQLDAFSVSNLLQKTAIERVEAKTQQIAELLSRTNNNFEEAFYHSLMRSFGQKINSGPFEMLANSLSFNVLLKNKDSLPRLLAALLGQAGFVDKLGISSEEDRLYVNKLNEEYSFMKSKYGLNSLPVHVWNFFRVRPAGFPTVRLAQLASLIHKRGNLFALFMETNDINGYYQIFDVCLHEYWKTHYSLGKESKPITGIPGKSFIYSTLINVVAPFKFIYGRYVNNPRLQQSAIELLYNLPPEKNHITDKWSKFAGKPQSALHSQGALQLINTYCKHKRCIECAIGHLLISREA